MFCFIIVRRNVVERAIDRLKKWKLLKNRVVQQYVPKLYTIVSILASTIYKFSEPLYDNTSNKNKYIKQIFEHIDDCEYKLKSLVNESNNLLWKSVARNQTETIDFVINTKYLPRHTSSDMKFISTGFFNMKLSKRYLISSFENLKIYEHKSVENCIKLTGIVSRYVSSTKHSLILKLYPAKPVDTQFYCSCKSGVRTTNPCAHSLCILILIQSIQKKLSRLLSTRNTTTYHSGIKFEQYSSHYQAIHDNIKDCKIYKECRH